MEIGSIFSIGVAKADATQHLATARSLFKPAYLHDVPNSPGHRTSLGRYIPVRVNSNLFDHEPGVAQMKSYMVAQAVAYLNALGYDTSDSVFGIGNIWLNEMTSRAVGPPHNHYGTNVSGTFYVDMPKGCSPTMFVTPLEKWGKPQMTATGPTPFNIGTCNLRPKEGEIHFWESFLIHHVPPGEFEGVRRTISFDVLVTDELRK